MIILAIKVSKLVPITSIMRSNLKTRGERMVIEFRNKRNRIRGMV